MQVLEELAEQVAWRLGQVEGFSDVRSESESGIDEIRLTVDHDRARNLGLTSSAVANMVSGAMRGQTIQRIRGIDGEIDVVLAFRDVNRQTIDDLRNLPISFADNQTVKLASIADIDQRAGAGRIFRENRRTSLGIAINLQDIASEEARTEISKVMDQMIYPTGYTWSYGRSFGNDMDAMNTMLFNIGIAFFLIYLIMASLFESLLYPTSVISCIFFGVIGTTVLGLLPLCFGTTQIGGGGLPYFPMARAIVGGLTFSTIITLLVLPSIYVILDDVRIWGTRILRTSVVKG